MSDTQTITAKKTARTRKTTTPVLPVLESQPLVRSSNLKQVRESFNALLEKITQAKDEFDGLQKEIAETRESWDKEQKRHTQDIQEKRQQNELERKREQETYEYEVSLSRKKAEDEFAEKKAKWERELAERKEEIENDERELEKLKKLVEGFENEKEKVVKEACLALQKELTGKFEVDKKLREQEFKGEKEILVLKLEVLTAEKERQAKEIESFKRSLEDATRQIKEIAVKVIESGNTSKTSSQEANKTD